MFDFDALISEIEVAFPEIVVPANLANPSQPVSLDMRDCVEALVVADWRGLELETLLSNFSCFIYLDASRYMFVFPAYLRAFVEQLRKNGSYLESMAGLLTRVLHDGVGGDQLWTLCTTQQRATVIRIFRFAVASMPPGHYYDVNPETEIELREVLSEWAAR